MCKQKKWNKFINLAMALILLAFMPVISLGAEDDFVTENGVLIKYNGTDKELTIPYGVTSIGGGAFWGSGSLKSIVIPKSVTSIAKGALDTHSLTDITVSENNPNFSSIDGVLFNKDKTELIRYPLRKPETSYDVPSGVVSIAERAFDSCHNLVNITLPDGIVDIGLFWGCTSLTSVVIPNSVTNTEHYAFMFCTSLTSVVIPESVTSIGNNVFLFCESLTTIDVSENNPEYSGLDGGLFSKDKTKLIHYPMGKSETSYNIPSSVKTIMPMAFYDCKNLVNVILPDGLEEIGYQAFGNCSYLVSFVIPDSVTSIGNGAFNCFRLTAINVNPNNPNYSSLDGVLFNKDKTELIHYPMGKAETSYDLPGGVLFIAVSSFSGNKNLISVNFPDGFIGISDEAFLCCTSLTSIVLPDSVTAIGDGAFFGCTSLTSVVIPESVTDIGGAAFFDCGNLTIYGTAGSYAEKYAKENEIKFQGTLRSTN